MLLVMAAYGRLGNQLWTHANVLAFCFQQRVPFYSCVLDIEDMFRGTHSLAPHYAGLCVPSSRLRDVAWRLAYKANIRARLAPWLHLGEKNCLDMDECSATLGELARTRTVFVSGFYLSAPAAMKAHAGELRKYFSPRVAVDAEVERLIGDARGRGEVLVGVHMRRGDYRTFSQGLMYYEEDEYAQVMRSIEHSLDGRSVSFLLCSDEPVDPLNFRGLNATISTSTPLADLYALARCDLIVGPDSTFSQWASFYGSVPLHVLNYKAVERYAAGPVIRHPNPTRDFVVFDPARFAAHAKARVGLEQLL